MSTNSYLNQTNFGYFQTLGYGDRIWPDVETENWQTIENRLLSVKKENSLITEGTFTYQTIDPSLTQVVLTQSGIQASFEGCINGSYYKIMNPLTWDINTNGDGVFYLYLRQVTGETNTTDVISVDAEVTQVQYSITELSTRLIMAIVTFSGSSVTINSAPTGQPKINTMLDGEVFYDTVISAGLDQILDIHDILNINPVNATVVKYVGYSPISFSNPLLATPYIIWITYNTDTDTSKFTIHNVSQYETIGLRLFIKYSTS